MTGSRESIRITGIISAFVAGIILTGCVSPSYYIHVSYHHLKLIHDRKSVKVLINDPVIPQELKVKLSLTQEIRSFASTRLLLPDNDSYTTYTDLKQPYLMWNVVAAPELSLEPVRWDFLFAGTLSYRGFYTLEKAKAFADKLKKRDMKSTSAMYLPTRPWAGFTTLC